MTIYGHIETMKRAKVSELKARLSEYLGGVRAGETVVVCDRNTPIARLVPYQENPDDFLVHEPPRSPASLGRVRGVKPRHRVDVVKLLRESREER